MTSMDSEAVASILCTSKQTRFDIAAPNYRELDVEGLSITVATSSTAGGTKAKAKGKAQADGAEVLGNAKLRLKAGQRYALIGKNGTGKSSKPEETPTPPPPSTYLPHSLPPPCPVFVWLLTPKPSGAAEKALLKAIAEKLIPGIPEKTRVAILQQTDVGDANVDETPKRPVTDIRKESGPAVLEEVIDRATARNELQKEIAGR